MRSSGVSACNQVKLSGEVKQRDEFSWSFHSENIVAVPGFKSGFNRCDFQVNFKGAQLVCHDNPPQFHSLGIRLCAHFLMSVRLRCLTTFLLPLDLDISPSSPPFLSVCLSVFSLSSFRLLLFPAVTLSFSVFYCIVLLPFPRIFSLCSLLVLCDSFG